MSSSQLSLLAISGSLRIASSNTRLLRAAARLAPPSSTVTLFEGIELLPPFNPDREDPVPPTVSALRAAIARADALLISCPEYARGVPGAFKNAIDWCVGGIELYEKPVALFNASPRATHAQAALRLILDTVGTRRVESADLTLPLAGRDLSVEAIVGDPVLAEPLAQALAALVLAVSG